MVPRLVIDARAVGPLPHGFSRYITHLGRALAARQSERGLSYEPFFLVGASHPGADFEGFPCEKLVSPFLHPREILEIPVMLKKLGAAAYHSPTFSSLAWSPCPWIVTVHDLNHLNYGGFREKLYYWTLLRSFARRADALVTVSEFSRGELAGWLGIPRAAIELCLNVVERPQPELSAPEVDGILARHGLNRRRYLLCISNPKPHKNLRTLLDAFSTLQTSESAAQQGPLVVTVPESTPGVSGARGVLALPGLSDIETRALVQGASAVVCPSRYEGFGLVPVEAAVGGASLVVSDIAAHHEGLMDLEVDEARWVPSLDRRAWFEAFRAVGRGEVKAPSARSVAKILDRFSLARMGDAMDRIYRRVLKVGV